MKVVAVIPARYGSTRFEGKPLADILGKPMIQWVLDALTQSTVVENVILVGLSEKSDVTCGKPLYFIPNQGKMLENLRAGAEKVLEFNKKAEYVLLVSSDIPAITGEMVDWTVNVAMETKDDVYYNIIQREVMEKRFPGSKRTYTRLKDMDVCGGDMNVGRLGLLTSEDTDLWEKITNARKSPLKQAGLIGFGTLFLLLFRQLTLEKAAANIMKRLKITGRAIVCPYAEIGMDIDKPHQLEILRADLAKAQRRKNKATPKKAAVKKAAARKPQKKAK